MPKKPLKRNSDYTDKNMQLAAGVVLSLIVFYVFLYMWENL